MVNRTTFKDRECVSCYFANSYLSNFMEASMHRLNMRRKTFNHLKNDSVTSEKS